jgi:hypothetical protein
LCIYTEILLEIHITAYVTLVNLTIAFYVSF